MKPYNVTGKRLIDAGFPQGPALGEAIKSLAHLGMGDIPLQAWVKENAPAPRMKLQKNTNLIVNLDAYTKDEIDNQRKVIETMLEVMKTPNIISHLDRDNDSPRVLRKPEQPQSVNFILQLPVDDSPRVLRTAHQPQRFRFT